MALTLREKLIGLMDDWRAGSISGWDVLEAAEDIWESGDEWPKLPDSDLHSIELDVLRNLSIMEIQLICPGDIEEVLLFLNTKPGQELASWKRWRSYWDNIDYERRAQMLKDNNLYLTGSLSIDKDDPHDKIE